MIGLLRIIFVFAIIYMVIRFLTRHIFPLLLGTYVNKKMSEMHQSQQAYYNAQQKREGEITIDNKPDKKKRYSQNTGEYVDFEEI
ncbi:MAG TPA: DUF4834 family protein [Bacteroidales bacterium]